MNNYINNIHDIITKNLKKPKIGQILSKHQISNYSHSTKMTLEEIKKKKRKKNQYHLYQIYTENKNSSIIVER